MSGNRLSIALVLLAAAAAGCSRSGRAPEKRPAVAAAPKRNAYRGRLLAITGEEGDAVKVWSADGKRVLAPYQLEKRGLALFDGEYALRLEGGCYFSAGAEEHLGGGLRNAGGELSLSAYVHPARVSQKGAGCIIGYGPRGGGLRFALMQEKDALTFRISAAGPRTVKLSNLKSAKPFHLVLAVGKKEIVFYRNGKKTGTSPGIKGDFSAWKDGRLLFGNDGKGARPWRGRIERAALYNKALEPEEVSRVAGAFLKGLGEREPVARVELVGELLKRAKYRMPWGENTYRDGLAECEYRVKKVIRGEYKEKNIRVAELMFVDRIFLTNSRKKIGGEYRLLVEELDANPQMAEIERGLLDVDEDSIDMVLHAEMSPLEALPKDQWPKPGKEKGAGKDGGKETR